MQVGSATTIDTCNHRTALVSYALGIHMHKIKEDGFFDSG